ncbi:major facilitator superfamily domain-containing protein [Scheffersomyces amazonensis]|uniref:major facilitator superfamily domain-containing protein n=1 Tax=Scheffersomyces amazonensis TaxID=1078765 RepID=UPI00315CB5AF
MSEKVGVEITNSSIGGSNGFELSDNDELNNFEFTKEERKKYLRKVDYYVLPLIYVTYMILAYDKGILSHAVLFNFTLDLGLTKITITPHGISENNVRYSDVVTVFYASYAAGTYPLTWLSTKFSVKKFVSLSVLTWSVVVFTTPACKTYAGIMVNRAILGFLEAGVAPTFNIYMSRWWTRKEQSIRSSVWYSAYGLSGIISAFIDYGLGTVSTKLKHWQPMFFFIGSLTLVWSIIIFILLPESPQEWSRISQREKDILKAQQENENHMNQKFDLKQALEALTSFNTWSAGLLAAFAGVIAVGLLNFLTLIITGFGFGLAGTLALTIPISVIYIIGMVFAGYICRKFNGLVYLAAIVCDLICLVGTFICWFSPRHKKGLLYFGTFLLAFQSVQIYVGYYLGTVNAAGASKKTLSNSVVFALASAGNIAGSYIFSSTPGPEFRGAWIGCTCVAAASAVIAIFSRFYLQHENRKKDKLMSESSTEEKANLTDSSDLSFRYII